MTMIAGRTIRATGMSAEMVLGAGMEILPRDRAVTVLKHMGPRASNEAHGITRHPPVQRVRVRPTLSDSALSGGSW